MLREERLVALATLLLGATGVALAVDGLRTGMVEVKFGTFSRVRNPTNFWFHVTVFFLFGAGLIVGVGARFWG